MLLATSCARSVAEELPRHPLETQALVEPIRVLRQIDIDVARPEIRADQRTVALLELARANACRVIADWQCQRAAGARAKAIGDEMNEPMIALRGLVAESRGALARQDYTGGERLLGEGELRLRKTPNTELASDIYLAYSSFSHMVGKHSLAVQYATRGLEVLAPGEAIPMQVRLLRNRARAGTLTGDLTAARADLARALMLVEHVNDPKLRGELHLENARLARERGDTATQRQSGEAILAESAALKNSQLEGLAHEVLGLAALDEGDLAAAQQSLRAATDSFRDLGLQRDELRATRHLLRASADGTALAALTARMLDLDEDVIQRVRAEAADDFDQRIRYAEQERDLTRLESESAISQANRRFSNLLLVSVGAGALLMGIALVAQRRANQRQRELLDSRQRALMQTSHELRNPIGGVIGIGELLQRSNLNAAQREMVGALMHAAHSIGKLGQDLLDRGLAETGRLRLSPEPTHLGDLLQAVVVLMRPTALEKGLVFEFESLGELNQIILLDGPRVQQTLLNLIGNAVKFTKRGSIRLRADVSGKPGGEQTIGLSVADTGDGIPYDEQAVLFRPFTKGRAGERQRKGAGLGLSIAQELVRLMGGDLSFESHPGRGTTFRFQLRGAPSELPEPADPLSRVTHDAAGMVVLIADDDDDMALVLGSQLQLLGCTVHRVATAGDVSVAMGQVEPALLLLDVELPDQSGIALARAAPWPGQSPRVVIVSGHEAPDVLPEGVDEWVAKPVTLDRLTMLIAASTVGA